MGTNEINKSPRKQSEHHIDAPDWFHEPGAELGYRPWQHTPLRPYSDDVIPHQKGLYSAFEALTDSPQPPTLDEGITRLVHMDFMMGNARRQTECAANFGAWIAGHSDEYDAIEADPEQRWLLHEAMAGHAHPAGLLKIMASAPSLKSLDLQVLTMPYGYRSLHLPAMRQEMKQALEGVGGEYFDQPIDIRLPKIASHPLEIYTDAMDRRGLLVTDKRQVGHYLPDGESGETIRIIERRAYVIDADPGQGFSVDALAGLHTRNTSNEYVAATHYIDELIDTGSPLVVPTSTMVYARRPKEVRERAGAPLSQEYRDEAQEIARQLGMTSVSGDVFSEYISRD